jgi:putative ABC transport system permease protein
MAWRLALRDIRSGALSLMILAIVVSVTAVSAVGILSKRVEQALLKDAQASLGADRLLVSDRTLPDTWQRTAETMGLRTVQGSQFPSMVLAGDRGQLVSVKTVEAGYPLRGRLEVQTAQGLEINPPVRPGHVLIDPSLAARLNIAVGDRLQLGRAALIVQGLILLEPDRGMNFVNLSPRVIAHHDDLDATGLVSVGSRMRYRLWVGSEDPQTLIAYDRAILPTLAAGQRFETIDNARPELRNALDRANGFLSLTGMVAMLTACAAMALAARRLGWAYRPRLAVMKVMGASGAQLRGYWAVALGVMVLGSAALGLVTGYLVQMGLASALVSLMQVTLPPMPVLPWEPLLQGLALSLGMTLVFAWPAVLQAIRVPAMASLRDLPDGTTSSRAVGRLSILRRLLGPNAVRFVLFWSGMVGLLWLGSQDFSLALLVALGFALVGLVVFGLLITIFRGMGYLLSSSTRLPWTWISLRRALVRRSLGLSAQVLGLGMALSALMLLAFVRTDLVNAWDRSLPADAPNRFLINIVPGQESGVTQILQDEGVTEPVLYPMVRGRLVRINDREVSPEAYADDRAQRLVDREMNLSYAATLPAHNRIARGQPLDPQGQEVSVEDGIAKTLGIAMGDVLEFDVSGERVPMTVTSLRSLRWDSMQANFFMIASPAVLKDLPQTFITSFHLPRGQGVDLERRLLGQYPGVSLIDLDSLLAQIRRILGQVVAAVQSLFVFSLIAGALVLWAALVATREERLREAALLRAFGASRAQLVRAQMLELAFVGALAGLASAVLAQGLGGVVAEQIFSLPVPFRLLPLAWGALIGAVICMASGWLALRSVLNSPAVTALRATA